MFDVIHVTQTNADEWGMAEAVLQSPESVGTVLVNINKKGNDQFFRTKRVAGYGYELQYENHLP